MTGLSDAASRAARLSRIPGVTIAEAARRFGIPEREVKKARKVTPRLSIAELALAALTGNGTQDAGELGDLKGVAGWIDYINHDGCTAADVRKLLQSLPGDIELSGRRYRLLRPWP